MQHVVACQRIKVQWIAGWNRGLPRECGWLLLSISGLGAPRSAAQRQRVKVNTFAQRMWGRHPIRDFQPPTCHRYRAFFNCRVVILAFF